MAAKKPHLLDEQGQSLMEFLLMVPMMLGLIVILYRVNSAIQMSIVNQQYARAQAMFISQNSAVYPRRDLANSLAAVNNNQILMGVSDQVLDPGALQIPKAPVFAIARSKKLAGAEPQTPDDSATERAFVRVRNTISLCTPSFTINTKSGPQRLNSTTLSQPFDPRSFNYCYFNLAGRTGRDLQ